MKKQQHEHRVGVYRPLRRKQETEQIEALEAAECGRIWSCEEHERVIRYLRGGETIVLPQAHCLGSSRDAIESFIDRIFARGARIEVLEPPMIAESLGAARIAFRAVAGLAGDSRAHLPHEAREYGSMNREIYEARRTKETVAKRVWKKRGDMTIADRLAQPEMRGWTKETAYRILGVSGAKSGPKRRT